MSATAGDDNADFVIVTGLSGAGRSTVANTLEDQGWYVVDNLPPQLLTGLGELISGRSASTGTAMRVAAVVDARSRAFFSHLQTALGELRGHGWTPQVVFLDATDETLVRRFESVRRPHPLQGAGRLLDGIHRERAMVRELRSEADVVIDTSGLNVHQLTRKVEPMFAGEEAAALRLAVMSFGFKYGIPLDADFVLDLRFLPNPFWVPELRPHNGRDPQVADFVLAQPGAGEFIEKLAALMVPIKAGYLREGRRYATVAIGCTGGKHRSVAVAEALAEALTGPAVETFVVHRDLGQE